MGLLVVRGLIAVWSRWFGATARGRWRCGLLREQGVQTIHPAAPDLFVPIQQLLRPPEDLGIGAYEPFPTVRMLGDQTCAFEHGHVLLDGGEGHLVVLSQPRHRRLTQQGSADDVAAGPVREGTEQPIDLIVGQRGR